MNDSVTQKVAAYFDQYPKRCYDKGQILIHAGDKPQAVYYIASGKVRQYNISYRGDEVVVNIFKERAFFPMLWAITDAENHYFFAAESDTEVRIAPKEAVVEFLRANPDVMYDLLSRLYSGIDGLLGRMAHLMAGTAKSRVIYELILECRRFGKAANDGSYHLALKETDLAAHSGLSRETVSRELHKIARDQLIVLVRGGITVPRLDALEEKLGTEL